MGATSKGAWIGFSGAVLAALIAVLWPKAPTEPTNQQGPVNQTVSGQGVNVNAQGSVTVNVDQPQPAVDRCAHHRIRTQAAKDECERQCDASRGQGLDKCEDDGCRGGVRNAHTGCIAGCAGSAHAAQADNCWER